MRRLPGISVILVINLIFVALILMAMGFRLNLTNSIPVGLYRITTLTNLKNSFVIFCPDDRLAFKQGLKRHYISYGLCPGSYGYLMKKVVGTAGDKVTVTAEGVFINQKIIPFSKPKLIDGMHHSLPQWRTVNYQLKEDEIMTMTSQSEWSFDGRYYGLIHLGQIKGVITPIWVKPMLGKHE